MKHITKNHKEYLQSAMFGFNDALVSTTGVIVGVAAGTGDKDIVILAGVVTILVEALSMGSGQYLSLRSARQLDKKESFKMPAISGIVMFISYFLAGLVPLLSVLIFPIEYSAYVAIAASLTCLLVLGYAKGKVVGASPLRSALEVFVIGGIATAIGLIAGNLLTV
ncbi:MAG TPA: VIT1/CCC1 transporter family protein [Candidatus Saccharimonadaceae bacterium]|nr:VIT1/CCC1 transporter family protein [Candidatus Saccharimonadaceae bacterium]